MYFLRCGNDAGIGSEFDATKYYTKDDIDQMMSDYYTQSEVDNLISNNKNTIFSGSMSLNSNDEWYVNGGYATGDEYRSSIISPSNGSLKNLVIKQSNTLATGSVIEVTVLVNNTDTQLSLQLTSADGTNFKSDASNTVPVNQGDLISLHIQEIGGVAPGGDAFTCASYFFDAEE
jgi:hypothetical protein